ncbi:MAG: excalibur calcium-binding domain-containing protein [Sphingobium sp.]|nr:excalibur calcium-binding domain-containing protein [Sphingobium sp.]
MERSTGLFRAVNARQPAWAAGAAPIYRGQPGYDVSMDGDLDGIACEPVRR